MTFYTFDAANWYAGPSDDEVANSVPVAPPDVQGSPVVGDPWPRWSRVEWTMETYSVPVVTRKITPIAYRNRFTLDEKAAIYVAAIIDPSASTQAKLQAASLRASLDDVAAAAFIDLEDESIRSRTQGLEAAHIIGAGRALEILDSPIQPGEAYV